MTEREMNQLDINVFKTLLDSVDNIVFFGGAGVSTESGIPDFRSASGLYHEHSASDYTPEEMLSHDFFMEHTEAFYRFYRSKIIHADAKPNAAHLALARLEKAGKLKAVITQNIDGLHQMAGSKNVLELHGSIHRNACMKCGASYGLDHILATKTIPLCNQCHGIIKPDVVLYQEMLNSQIMERAISFIMNSDMLIIGGTSLTVYPATGLVDAYRGSKLVLINKTGTPFDDKADYVHDGPIGELFSRAMDE
jgi:NAD-dependent deacetylase